MAVLLALASALVYGGGDFCGGLASRRAPVLTVAIGAQLVGALGLAVVVLVMPPELLRAADVAWGTAAGVAGSVGLALLYGALAAGTMSVVAPLTAVCSAVVPVAVGLVTGERPTVLALIGVVLALPAIALVGSDAGGDGAQGSHSSDGSAASGPHPSDGGAHGSHASDGTADGSLAAATCAGAAGRDGRAGPAVAGARRASTHPARLDPAVLVRALAAGTAFGLYFVLLAQCDEAAGVAPLVPGRLAGAVVLATMAVVGRRRAPLPRAAWALTAVCGLLDSTANALYLLAAQRGLLSLVAVLGALYPASTVVLARIVLDERLGRRQLVGLAVAAAAVVLVAAGG